MSFTIGELLWETSVPEVPAPTRCCCCCPAKWEERKSSLISNTFTAIFNQKLLYSIVYCPQYIVYTGRAYSKGRHTTLLTFQVVTPVTADNITISTELIKSHKRSWQEKETHETDHIMSQNTLWEDPIFIWASNLPQFKGLGTNAGVTDPQINNNANHIKGQVINYPGCTWITVSVQVAKCSIGAIMVRQITVANLAKWYFGLHQILWLLNPRVGSLKEPKPLIMWSLKRKLRPLKTNVQLIVMPRLI